MIPLSTYLKQYKVGDIVDVVANGTNPRNAPTLYAEDS
jgi:large subunit ribosomal protein L21e